MKTVIMAGGRGTRISSVASDIPQPMVKIVGVPVLEHKIRCLKEHGFTDIILTVSHLGEKKEEYFGGGRFGVHIEYYFEETPLCNVGELFKLKDKLTDDFLCLMRILSLMWISTGSLPIAGNMKVWRLCSRI